MDERLSRYFFVVTLVCLPIRRLDDQALGKYDHCPFSHNLLEFPGLGHHQSVLVSGISTQCLFSKKMEIGTANFNFAFQLLRFLEILLDNLSYSLKN